MRKKRSGLASSAAGRIAPRNKPKEPEQYKEFKDKASYSHGYEGDGHEAEEFFREHSNFDSLIKQMSKSERDAFQEWCRGWFMDGQQWYGFDNMTSRDQELTRIYDKYFDQAKLDAGVTLVRRGSAELLGIGRRARSLEQLQALEGRIFPAAGSMSFGAAAQGLTIGDSSKNVEYKLRIPKGTVGAGMWVGDHRINGWGPDQREFVTNRDVNYRVGKTTYDRARDVYVVELDYMGRYEHDYGKTKADDYARKKTRWGGRR